MNQKSGQNRSKSPTDTWQEWIKAELKTNSKLGKAMEKAGMGGYENEVLTLYFENEDLAKAAKGQIEPLKKKLTRELQPCKCVNIQVGTAPVIPQPSQSVTKTPAHTLSKKGNPLQALNFAAFGQGNRGEELSQPVLEAAVNNERNCGQLYQLLCSRTKQLAGGVENTITVDFNWRLRVGGTRGFRELLLPVFHPVFGVPYIPSSSLKGAARAWARSQGESAEAKQILGMLEGKIAKAAKVEFLDAFPTKACLSVDVATPQWHWQNNKVAYKPEPHLLLSMEQPQFLIGLRPTQSEHEPYVKTVRNWLENALKSGIGSRVSGGYGRALGQVATLPHSKTFEFELWTQGMYGSEPPSKVNRRGEPEFRTTAIRGILRYWFRSVAMSLYAPSVCQDLEESLFGKLSQQGKCSISTIFNPSSGFNPYIYNGKICLEARDENSLALISQLLILASHLGGVGRGSRRPLHFLDINGYKQMRGCYWGVDDEDLPLAYDLDQWQQFFKQLKAAFEVVRSPLGNYTSSPGVPKHRQQDVLDANAQIWLIKSPTLLAPNRVKDWQQQGLTTEVRGSALDLFYGDQRFKGSSIDGRGNAKVGGALETPSFVWIKSIFPSNSQPYQVVTLFGSDDPDRRIFANALEALSKQHHAILAIGKMPTSQSLSSPRPQRR